MLFLLLIVKFLHIDVIEILNVTLFYNVKFKLFIISMNRTQLPSCLKHGKLINSVYEVLISIQLNILASGLLLAAVCLVL